jgi:hypothetical protein
MKVFNLTDKELDYRGKHLGPYKSMEFPEITFIPDRDKALAQGGVLAFGQLPKGWAKPEPVKEVPAPKPAPKAPPLVVKPAVVEVKVADAVVVEPKAVEEKDWKNKKK